MAEVTPADTLTAEPLPRPGSSQEVRLPNSLNAGPVSGDALAVVQPGQPLTSTKRQGGAPVELLDLPAETTNRLSQRDAARAPGGLSRARAGLID